jgi:CRP-like cAMP-binding protein
VAKPKLENVLAYVPMFRDLSKRQLKHLASYCEVGDFMADYPIVKQGDTGDAVYVVLTGQAKVTVGKKFVGRVLPGDHFGEIAVLDGGERSATVTSETPMTLLILRREEFIKALREDPDLALHMMEELARMFRRVSSRNTQ